MNKKYSYFAVITLTSNKTLNLQFISELKPLTEIRKYIINSKVAYNPDTDDVEQFRATDVKSISIRRWELK